jgi:sugar transferase (PEP-CTERM system associated)
VIRLFNHYLPRRLLLQMSLDFGLIVFVVLGIFAAYVRNAELLLPLAATHGLSLATGLFVINTATGFYQPARKRSMSELLARVGLSTLFALPLAYGVFLLTPVDFSSAKGMALVAILGFAGINVHRVFAAQATVRPRTRSRIMILGSGPAAELVCETLTNADPDADVIGFVPSPNETASSVPASRILPIHGSLASTALAANVNEIVVALTERRGGSMPMRDLLDCKIRGIRVFDIATHFEKTLGQIRVDFVNAGWLIFGDGFNQGLARTAIKRAFDVVSASVLLLVSAPLMLLTAIAIRLESPGPILFRQQRVGLNGATFDVVKFRSMRVDAEGDGKPRWATKKDDRVTRIGKIIRLLRIDELPQLFNVFKGEMSIVGPRPERPFFVDELTRRIPYYAVRHSVKPGVTGWAQVRYHYGSSVEDAQQKLHYDLYYVKNHSLFLDLLILFETVAVVLTGRGAH